MATLAMGEFDAKETILVCPQCKRTYRSHELKQIVPVKSTFGYDVMVFVGKAALLHCRRDADIIQELEAKKISICPSEIAYLQRRFIVYLSIAHKQSASRINEALKAQGGYILHLDGTCEGDSPHLMSGLDEISGIVLHNVKTPSEKAASIIPFLNRIKQDYGTALAVVSDMSRAIIKAVKDVFPHVLFFVCHFHFLRDIGKDLMGKGNDLIRKRLQKHKITSKLLKRSRWLKEIIDKNPALIETFNASIKDGQLPNHIFEQAPVVSAYGLIRWALAGKKQGNGLGFPFDRPYVIFAKRLEVVSTHLDQLLDIQLRGQWRDNRPFYRVRHDLQSVVSDPVLRKAVREIDSKCEIFDLLRDAMRITIDKPGQGLNDDGSDTDIGIIKKSVTDFRAMLLQDDRYHENKDYQKMIEQIDHYWEALFADPITVDTAHGRISIQPQRTNNILERFFRDIKRCHRRKSGNHSMSKKLKAMLADTALVKNLQNDNYMKLLLNGKLNLEELFSEIDVELVRDGLNESHEDSERIPSKIRSLIKLPNLPQIITNMFQKTAKKVKSN